MSSQKPDSSFDRLLEASTLPPDDAMRREVERAVFASGTTDAAQWNELLREAKTLRDELNDVLRRIVKVRGVSIPCGEELLVVTLGITQERRASLEPFLCDPKLVLRDVESEVIEWLGAVHYANKFQEGISSSDDHGLI